MTSSSAVFKRGVGVILVVVGDGESKHTVIPDNMLLSAMETHVSELIDWVS